MCVLLSADGNEFRLVLLLLFFFKYDERLQYISGRESDGKEGLDFTAKE